MDKLKALNKTVVSVLLCILFTQVLMPIGSGLSQNTGNQPDASDTGKPSTDTAKVNSLGLMQQGVVDFSITFNPRNGVQLQNFVSNSQKKSFGVQSALSEEQFEANYSPTKSDYDQVISYLQANNFAVIQTWPNRLMITAEGSVADVQRAFGTEIGLFVTGNVTFYKSVNDITIPVSLSDCGICGISLNSLPNTPNIVNLPQSNQPETNPDTASALLYANPSAFRDVYGTAGAVQGGWDGTGTTIAIVDAFGDPSIGNDFNLFNAYYGLPNATLTVEGTQVSNGLGWDTETALDVEWAHAMAPGAAILLKVAADNYDNNLYGAINSLVSRASPPDVISLSWGRIELSTDPTLSTILAAAASKGIKVFVSSGDKGAYNNGYFGVSYPAADPNVIAVGGTEVYYNTVQGTRQYYEVGWSDSGDGWASGGGYSTVFNEPVYQVNAGIPDATGKRAVPDVSLTGGPASAVRIYCGGFLYGACGTSLSAPMMAGIAAVALNGNWNLDNTALYSLYPSSSQFKVAFHDVYLSGYNGYYYVRPGWDAVTGLGSINFQNFANIFQESAGVSLTGQYLASSSVVRGQSFSMSYLVDNPNSGYPLTQIGLGATIRLHGTTTNITDATNDIYTDLTGGSSIQNRQFVTSYSLAAGSYDVLWDVWMGPPGYGNLLSSSGWQMSQLQVTSASPTFDFGLNATPSSEIVSAGGSTTYDITSTLVGTSSQTVTLSCSNLISGVSYAFSPTSGNPSFVSTLTLQTSPTTPQGTYLLVVTGTGGGIAHSITLQLNIGDSYEPDNSFSQYSSMTVTTSLQSQSRSIEPSGDNDYIRFYATRGSYTFYTSGSTDTYGYLYDSNENLLTYNDDSGGNWQFLINYQIPENGYYFLRVKGYSTIDDGPYTLYYLYSSAPLPPNQVSPDNGDVSASNTAVFTWSSSIGATSYQIEVTGPSPGTYSTTSTVYLLMFLNEGDYTWRMRAYNSSGWSDWTPAWSFTLDMTPPSTPNPDDGASGWLTTSTPSFTWSANDAVSGVAGYYWRVDNGPETWTTTAFVTLMTQTDGTHTFYVKAKDNAGNNGTYGSHAFQIDTTYPSGSITINQASEYTTSNFITLSLSYSDQTSGVDKVRYSNDGVWDTESLETASASKTWTLSSGDGAKTVYYQIRDYAGLLSNYSASIVMDTTPPTGSIIINGASTYASSTAVTLTLTYIDANDLQVRFSNDGLWDTEPWESAVNTKAWNLPSGDGQKTVYYQLKDAAGLLSSTYSTTITLDTVAPSGTIQINSGSIYTTSASVTLTLTSQDSMSGVSQVRFSNNGVWDNVQWEPPAVSRAWMLTAGDGSKAVYYQIKDNAGLISSAASAQIILDTTAPTANAGQSRTVTAGDSITFDGSGSSDANGIASYKWDFDDGAQATGATATHTYTSVGPYYVILNVEDAAGNKASTTITITVQPKPAPTTSPITSPTNSPTTNPTPTATPTPTPTPTPNPSGSNTIPVTVVDGTTEQFAIGGDINATQISNAKIQTDPSAKTTMLSFTITGQTGTTGTGNITIPKSQVPYGTTPIIYIDNQIVDGQGYTQDANNYYVWYTTHFSTHQLSIVFTGSSQPPQDPTMLIVIALVVVVVVCIAVAAVVMRKRGKTKN